MYRLNNPIRSYDWGSCTALPAFLGTDVETLKPQAEMWIGAHPDSPSQAFSESTAPQALDSLLRAKPQGLLGLEAVATFGKKLPFLVKVLAAKNALPLQVHPNEEQAKKGFRQEESMGLAREDPKRSYKDDNHKPEMIIALTDFKALCGFRDPVETAELFRELSDACRCSAQGETTAELLEWIIAVLAAGGGRSSSERSAAKQQQLRKVFKRIISDPQAPKLTENVFKALDAWLPERQGLAKTIVRPLETVLWLYRLFPKDPGVLLSMMLNHVHLKPGEALFLPAGNIHSYLTGMGIEVMASSDNVLRGGLTTKHVDVGGLLKLVDFQVLPAPELEPLSKAPDQRIFRPPIKDFQVQEITLSRSRLACAPIIQNGPLIVLCVEGKTTIETACDRGCLSRADSVFIGADEAPAKASLSPQTENCRLFAVTIATGK